AGGRGILHGPAGDIHSGRAGVVQLDEIVREGGAAVAAAAVDLADDDAAYLNRRDDRVESAGRVEGLARLWRAFDAGDASEIEVVAHPISRGIAVEAVGDAGSAAGSERQAVIVLGEHRDAVGEIAGAA